jgi:hypothetical protein
VLTRKEAKEEEKSKTQMRAYWREKKQQSRARETQEKKELDNLKRREKYKETKAKKSLSKNKSASSGKETASFTEYTTTNHDKEAQKPNDDDYKSPASKRKAISRCSKKLPRTPKKWLKVVDGIIKRATPRKRKLLDESGLLASPMTKRQIATNREIVLGLKEYLKKTKSSRKNKYHRRNLISTILNNAKKRGILTSLRQNLGIQWRTTGRGLMPLLKRKLKMFKIII